jgi:hypothetical protein
MLYADVNPAIAEAVSHYLIRKDPEMQARQGKLFFLWSSGRDVVPKEKARMPGSHSLSERQRPCRRSTGSEMALLAREGHENRIE